MKYPIYKPNIDAHTTYALDAIQSGWISNHGKYIHLATQQLQSIFNVKYAILMANGTCATHALFLALKYKYPSIHRIYVPNYVFIAPVNMALHEYPSGVSILKTDEHTLNMCEDEDYLMSLEKNSAIVIVHNIGNVINVPRINRIRPDIVIIEDCCEGIFGTYEDTYAGMGKNTLCSAVSFYGNKTITTGEGGAFFTNDDMIYNYISRLYSHGMTSERYIHDMIAYNYRMTNIEAGFLYSQLLDYKTIIQCKQGLYEFYTTEIAKYNTLSIPTIRNNTSHSYWMVCVICDTPKAFTQIEECMTAYGVEIRPFFYSMNCHLHTMHLSIPNTIEVPNKVILLLPSYIGLTYDDIAYIVSSLSKSL